MIIYLCITNEKLNYNKCFNYCTRAYYSNFVLKICNSIILFFQMLMLEKSLGIGVNSNDSLK